MTDELKAYIAALVAEIDSVLSGNEAQGVAKPDSLVEVGPAGPPPHG